MWSVIWKLTTGLLGLSRQWSDLSDVRTPTSPAPTPFALEPQGTQALHALVQRRLPESWHDRLEFELDNELGFNEDYDSFTTGWNPNSEKTRISSSTVPGLSRGLLTYLRQHGGDITWSGDTFESMFGESQVEAPAQIGQSWAKWRYMFNICTYSYTMLWYDWEQWEYLLDWAALHGINLPLAVNGQEYIWAEVYKDFGLSEDEILGYFSGPAFQAWQRMGNVHGSWERNVTREWIDQQWELQKRIVSRMVALGMTPVLPAFSGFVPEALHGRIGGPEFLKASDWNAFGPEFSMNTAIDPTWPTWQLVQETFLKKQHELYGGWTSHYYSLDLYNELQPTSTDLAYLWNNTRDVIASLKAADAEAVWVMQGWMFHVDRESWNASTIDALLGGAKPGELLILDLAAEAAPIWKETASFYGHDWLWCFLMNYGQEQGFYGNLDEYTLDIHDAILASGVKGMGLTMEGMNNNELVYEMVLDTAWSSDRLDANSWLSAFIDRRYALHQIRSNMAKEHAQEAWRLLAASAYNNSNPDLRAINRSPLEVVPSLDIEQARLLTYDTSMVVAALDHLITAAEFAPGLEDVDGFAYDLVDVARQAFMDAGVDMYRKMIHAWNSSGPDKQAIETQGRLIGDLLKDADTILGTNKNFLLSSWIRDARRNSDDLATKDFYEYQARNQITLWGTQRVFPWPLNRYASKSWHGVLHPFYSTNWEMYYKYLMSHTPSEYNQTAWERHLAAYEQAWVNEFMSEKDLEKVGNGLSAVEVIRHLRKKWGDWL